MKAIDNTAQTERCLAAIPAILALVKKALRRRTDQTFDWIESDWEGSFVLSGGFLCYGVRIGENLERGEHCFAVFMEKMLWHYHIPLRSWTKRWELMAVVSSDSTNSLTEGKWFTPIYRDFEFEALTRFFERPEKSHLRALRAVDVRMA
jgi:hypothetical protein